MKLDDLKTAIPLLLVSALASACAVGPQYQRPSVTLPDEIRGAAPAAGAPSETGSLADRGWWEILGDDTLTALVDEALAANHDLRLAAWRVEEARAEAGIARAESWPALQASAGWSRGRESELLVPQAATADLASVDLGVAWEIDLWGRVRRLDEAALARYLATEEARRAVQVSLVSEVASAYFRLRALDLQLEIARRTAAAFEDTLALFDKRLEAGLASSLETSSAAASLASTAATIPELERRIEGQENLLSLLLGRTPGPVPRGAALADQPLPPAIPAGLPSGLLERRPDVRRAEQELIAANAEVGVAVADYFPRISLTGAFGGVAPQVSELFGDGKRWSVGGGLLTPVLQGARLRDQHRAAVARWEQARVRYERSVTAAFTEVSTALTGYRQLALVEREQAAAVDALRAAVEVSGSRYLSGLSDYLEVLQARQQLLPAENALAQTRFERLATLVELYRALGGGWQAAGAENPGERSPAGAAAEAWSGAAR